MSKTIGTIFDMQGFSVHDGPGSRTTVFLKGCPLKCEWCANPESWEKTPQIMWRHFKCKGCLNCIESCEKGAISSSDGRLNFDDSICSSCEDRTCIKSCYSDAIAFMGNTYTLENLMYELGRQRDSWGDEGGVTFSGGEPLMQSDFLIQSLQKCHEEYIHTAIETTAFTNSTIFMSVMEHVDFAFIDVKHMDETTHKSQTGVSNDVILKNIALLANSDWNGRLVLRTPVIEGFNDTFENMNAQAEFMIKNDLKEINLLPFHRMGESKWFGIGKEYSYKDFQPTTDDRLMELKEIFTDKGIHCYIGSDTPF